MMGRFARPPSGTSKGRVALAAALLGTLALPTGACGGERFSLHDTITVAITHDSDDAEWVMGTDERLHYSEDAQTIEVGVDQDMGHVGLRFALPIPAGATIGAATLRLHRFRGDALATDTALVQVYDAIQVDPFDDNHEHLPREHVAAGLFPSVVPGFRLGTDDSDIESPNLSGLVQHVVDKPDWHEGSVVGFVLAVEQVTGWCEFVDSYSDPSKAARLTVTYDAK